jgi:hypothetical protein
MRRASTSKKTYDGCAPYHVSIRQIRIGSFALRSSITAEEGKSWPPLKLRQSKGKLTVHT